MKKIMPFLLILLLILTMKVSALDSVPVYLNFDNMEGQILSRNPMVLMNSNSIDSITAGRNSVSDMKGEIQQIIGQIDGLISGYTTKIGALSAAAPPDEADWGVSEASASIIDLYKNDIAALTIFKGSLQQQMDSLRGQQEDLGKTIEIVRLQTAMINNQLVWTGENLLLTYNDLMEKQSDISRNLSLMDMQLNILKLKQRLLMAGETDVNTLEAKIKQVNDSYNYLAQQKDRIKGELNLMLGRNFNDVLDMQSAPSVKMDEVNSVAYDEDSAISLSSSSYLVMIQEHQCSMKQLALNRAGNSNSILKAQKDLDNERIKLDMEKRKFKLEYYNSVEDVKNKARAYESEKYNLENEAKKIRNLELKYSYGMVSRLELETARTAYYGLESNVRSKELELLKSNRKYQYIKRGFVFN